MVEVVRGRGVYGGGCVVEGVWWWWCVVEVIWGGVLP